MTLMMPTCAQVTALLTDYEEGALRPLEWLGLKIHLGLCPPCRTFLDSFLRAQALLRRTGEDDAHPAAEQALAAALTALREGRAPRGPQHHPDAEEWAALAPGGDAFLALLLRAHLGHCEACRDHHGERLAIAPGSDPVASLKPHLPPETQWRWLRHGLGGGSAALLQTNPASGASLSLACLPGGRSTPVHDHLGFEGVLILAGGLQDGPAHLRAGDWISHGPGHRHGPTADPGETCWALIVQARPVRFTGWRGLVF